MYYWFFCIFFIIIITIYSIQNYIYCNKPLLSTIVEHDFIQKLTIPSQQMFNPSCFMWKDQMYIVTKYYSNSFIYNLSSIKIDSGKQMLETYINGNELLGVFVKDSYLEKL